MSISLVCSLAAVAVFGGAVWAVQDGDATAPPTAAPTPTPTPVPPPGHPDRPIRMVFAMPAEHSRADVEEAARALADRLSWYPDDGPPTPTPAPTTENGEAVEAPAGSAPVPEYTFAVEVVDSYAGVVAAMCQSEDAVIGWVDAWNYLVVEGLDCGTARYMVEVGRGLNASTISAPPVVIISNAQRWVSTRGAPVKELSDLRGQKFCRLATDTDDPAAWRSPALMLMAGGVDPVDIGEPGSLASVTDYESMEEMIRQIYDNAGACIAGVVPDDWLDQTEDVRDQLYRFDATVKEFARSVAIPNPVMVYPPTVTLAIRERVEEVLKDRQTDKDLLKILVGADGLADVEDGAFDEFRVFFEASGLDPVLMGR